MWNTKKHGDTGTKLYKTWLNMKSRCYNPNATHSKYYYGKNIKICEEWKNNYIAFKEWSLKNGFQDNLTIDRIDNNGDYCPQNCRWVSIKEQNENLPTIRKITYKGKEYTIKQISEITGLSIKCLDARYRRGWTVEEIFSTPKISKNKINKLGQFTSNRQGGDAKC